MNILLIIVLVILVWRVVEGYRRGMVKEIISLISLIVLSLVLALLSLILTSYLDKQIVNTLVAIILLLILCIVHRLVGIVFFSAKVISKLPVIHSVNKILGAVFGVFETVVFVWITYTLFYIFDMGMLKELFFQYVSENKILTYLYEYNYLLKWVNLLIEKIEWLPKITTMPEITDILSIIQKNKNF